MRHSISGIVLVFASLLLALSALNAQPGGKAEKKEEPWKVTAINCKDVCSQGPAGTLSNSEGKARYRQCFVAGICKKWLEDPDGGFIATTPGIDLAR